MNIQMTSTQALKSFAGVALFGFGLDLADATSCHLTQFAWFVLREMVSSLFWSVLAGLQASQTSVLEHHLYLLGCPAEIMSYVKPFLHLLGAAF
jgi:hypothetical protein